MRAGGRIAAAAAGMTLAAGTLAGCGIRATAVPVDAGAAPTRTVCEPPGPAPARTGDPQLEVRVYLVCGERLVAVRRLVSAAPQPGLGLVRLLLEQLNHAPDRAERGAGFTSAVPAGLNAVGGPDLSLLSGAAVAPAPVPVVWRLDRTPGGLPPFALGQVVCTLADAAVSGPGRPVVLAGPRGAPRSYTCGTALRTEPDAGATAGTPVG